MLTYAVSGESLETLVLTITPKIQVRDVLEAVSLCHAEGYALICLLRIP